MLFVISLFSLIRDKYLKQPAMAQIFNVKGDNWENIKEDVNIAIDSWPLMSSILPVVFLLILYLAFVLRLGPDFMTKREPYMLKRPLILYNFLQVVLSVYMTVRIVNYLFKYGLIPTACSVTDNARHYEMLALIWIYYVAKVSELLDTVFFILRKKYSQVTFLHVYHHSLMMVGTWLCLKYASSEHVLFIGLLNCIVHIFMYAYYGLSAMGPSVARYLFWKKYITKMQLTQFCAMLVYLCVSATVSNCQIPKAVAYMFPFNISTFLVLFLNFYRKSYKKPMAKQD